LAVPDNSNLVGGILINALSNLLGDALPESNSRDVPQNVVNGNQHKMPHVPKVRFNQMLGKSPYYLTLQRYLR